MIKVSNDDNINMESYYIIILLLLMLLFYYYYPITPSRFKQSKISRGVLVYSICPAISQVGKQKTLQVKEILRIQQEPKIGFGHIKT